MEYHIFLIYQKLTVKDFNFQLFGILRVSTLRFSGSPLLLITFYSNLSGRGVQVELEGLLKLACLLACLVSAFVVGPVQHSAF